MENNKQPNTSTKKPPELTKRQMELFDTYRANLPIDMEVITKTNNIIDKCVTTEAISGRTYDYIISGALLLACKQTDTPILAEEIAALTIRNGEPISAKKLQQESRVLKRELSLKVTPIPAEVFLNRFMDEFDLTTEQRNVCTQLLNKAESGGIDAKPGPSILAATVLDAARRLIDLPIEQKDITELSHSSPEQLRKYSRPLANS